MRKQFGTIKEAKAEGLMAWWRPMVPRVDKWTAGDEFENICIGSPRFIKVFGQLGEVYNGVNLARRLVVAIDGAPNPGKGYRLLERTLENRLSGYKLLDHGLNMIDHSLEGEELLTTDHLWIYKGWQEEGWQDKDIMHEVVGERCFINFFRRRIDPSVQDN